jgi:hypothetical protein
MTLRPLLLGAAASLCAGAALAQQTSPPHVDMPVAAQLNAVQTGPVSNPKLEPVAAPTPTAADVGVTYPAQAVPAGDRSPYLSDNVSGPTADAVVVKSAPVPDTPSSRQLYRPLSRAGQRSAPASN